MNQNDIRCEFCSSKQIIKKGKRKNKFEKIQLFQCNDCKRRFTLKKIKHKTYLPTVILNAISYYNIGYTQQQTSKLISQKFKVNVPQRTVSEWINQYKSICPYNKLRNKAIKLYPPENIIKKQALHHTQPYQFQYHQAKLELLFKDKLYNNQFINSSKFYEPIRLYLEKITTDKFPHHIFKQKQSSDAEVAQINNTNESRASKIKFNTLEITKLPKINLANKLAALAVNLAKSNKDRHQAIQNFSLINDSTTIATEVPVYLTGDDIKYFKKRGFTLDFEQNINSSDAAIAKLKENKPPIKTPITGHIDILQIRNGVIHILDYKPEASKINPIEQLTIYALALASRTKLALSDFKCAWFDENNYFEFFPLHAVYRKRYR